MTLLEVAKHALEAMEDAMYRADTHEFYDAKESLRYAIEQAEQAGQEPVGWVLITPYGEEDDICYTEPETVPDGWSYKPLYDTAPTPRKPLTDEEMPILFVGGLALNSKATTEIVRAVEKAHGIGDSK